MYRRADAKESCHSHPSRRIGSIALQKMSESRQRHTIVPFCKLYSLHVIETLDDEFW